MSLVVFDTSAVIALLRGEPGAALVGGRVGQAAMSAANLQELVIALLQRGLTLPVIKEMVQELRHDLHAHDREAAFAAALLTDATRLSEADSGIGRVWRWRSSSACPSSRRIAPGRN